MLSIKTNDLITCLKKRFSEVVKFFKTIKVWILIKTKDDKKLYLYATWVEVSQKKFLSFSLG